MSINRQITELVRKGRKPSRYISTNATEGLMILYLNNKYNIRDPSSNNLINDYKEYNKKKNMGLRVETPLLEGYELNLYYDDKDNLISDNRKIYIRTFYWKLIDMINNNPGRKFACKFDISTYRNDVLIEGHTEMIIYDPALNILEHVDSNNVPKQCSRNERAYFSCCELVNEIVKCVAELLPESPIYINNTDIYSGYQWGIQSMEAASNELVDIEKGGFCLAWCILLGDLALKNQNISIKEIICEIIKNAKKSKILDNDYMLYLIRGYIKELSSELNVEFDNEQSQHDASSVIASCMYKKGLL